MNAAPMVNEAPFGAAPSRRAVDTDNHLANQLKSAWADKHAAASIDGRE